MKNDELLLVILFAPVVAIAFGLFAIWISFEMDKAMYQDDTDDKL